jgi:hypothetical protein
VGICHGVCVEFYSYSHVSACADFVGFAFCWVCLPFPSFSDILVVLFRLSTFDRFFYVGYGVYTLIGWADSPLYFRMLTCLIGFPYMVALLDGIINSAKPSFKAFINLVLLTPVFLTSSLWFYVWFPCCEFVCAVHRHRYLFLFQINTSYLHYFFILFAFSFFLFGY